MMNWIMYGIGLLGMVIGLTIMLISLLTFFTISIPLGLLLTIATGLFVFFIVRRSTDSRRHIQPHKTTGGKMTPEEALKGIKEIQESFGNPDKIFDRKVRFMCELLKYTDYSEVLNEFDRLHDGGRIELTEVESYIMSQRFGGYGGRRSYEDLGEFLEKSPQDIFDIEQSALKKLHERCK